LCASSRSAKDGEAWVMDLRDAFSAYTSCTGAVCQLATMIKIWTRTSTCQERVWEERRRDSRVAKYFGFPAS